MSTSCCKKCFKILHVPMVKNRMCCKSSCVGNDILHAKIKPLVNSYHICSLHVHGVEHLPPGLLRLILSLVHLHINESIPIHPGDRSNHVNEFGERSSADKTILISINIVINWLRK